MRNTYEHHNYCASRRDRVLADLHRLCSNAHVPSACGETLSLQHMLANSFIVVLLSHVLDLGPDLYVFWLEEELHTLSELVRDC